MTQPLSPSPDHPRYWSFNGQTTLFIGGSVTDSLFQLPDTELIPHLDEMVEVGANVVRCTMSDRTEGAHRAYAKQDDGLYDLEDSNPAYWEKFNDFLEATAERNILVQIEVWDRFDFSGPSGNWKISPWNPDNNRNYTREETGFGEAYDGHPSSDRCPFFHTVPGTEKHQPGYEKVLPFQARFVDMLLDHTLAHDHILYCMNNETNTDSGWGRHWIRFIQARAREEGKNVYCTDMFDNGFVPEASSALREVIDNSDHLYGFLDISQINSRNMGDTHWHRLQFMRQSVAANPRPMNHTKIYSDGETSWGSGTPLEGIGRFWRNLLSNSATARFHRPGAGIGLNPTAKACIRAARELEKSVPFWNLEPAPYLLERDAEHSAWCAADPGKAFVVFLNPGHQVQLDLRALGPAGKPSMKVTWLRPDTEAPPLTENRDWEKFIDLQPPEHAPWVVQVLPQLP